MAKFMSFIGVMLAAGLLLALFSLLIAFFVALWQAPNTVVVGVLAALLAVAGSFGVKFFERQTSIKQERRAHQSKIYEVLVESIIKFASNSSTVSEEEMKQFIMEVTPRLIIHGSPEFIQAWNTFRSHSTLSEKTILYDIGVLLCVIRKDLGYEDKDVQPIELLRTFINDIDDNGRPLDAEAFDRSAAGLHTMA